MRTLFLSCLVVGSAGAFVIGTSSAASLPTAALGPKPAKATTKPPIVLEPLRPLHISEEGTPLTCQRDSVCAIKGQLGAGKGTVVAVKGTDGKRRMVLTVKWSPATVQFKIPRTIPAGTYALEIIDLKQKPLSNAITVHATRTSAEVAKECEQSPDQDGDGHARFECGGADCDDGNANRYPGAVEVCDAGHVDEDCDPRTFGLRDADGDGHPDARCCNGSACGDDCDDAKRGVHPNSPEVCNGYDDNCDGLVDEGVQMTAYRDNDRDLYGDPKDSRLVCPHLVPRGYVTNDLDCDDNNVAKNPRAGCP